MEHVKPPQPLSSSGSLAENWCTWKQQFELFMDLTADVYMSKPKSVKAKLLLNFIGAVGVSALDKITFDKPEDKDDMHILLLKFDEYFNPPKNEVAERYKFFTKKMSNNITLEEYVKHLNEAAESCNFGDLKESLIRDKVIMDIKDRELLEKIFDTKNLDLANLISIITTYKSKLVSMDKKEPEDKLKVSEKATTGPRTCWRCRSTHPMNQCPAWNRVCEGCGQKGHLQNPNACRIATLKKKHFEMTNQVDKAKNINTKETNLNINVPFTKKDEKLNQPKDSPSECHLTWNNMKPSAPELSTLKDTLYPNLSTVAGSANVSSPTGTGAYSTMPNNPKADVYLMSQPPPAYSPPAYSPQVYAQPVYCSRANKSVPKNTKSKGKGSDPCIVS